MPNPSDNSKIKKRIGHPMFPHIKQQHMAKLYNQLNVHNPERMDDSKKYTKSLGDLPDNASRDQLIMDTGSVPSDAGCAPIYTPSTTPLVVSDTPPALVSSTPVLVTAQPPPPPQKHVFTLCIDGGGMRGIMPAIWLLVLKEEFEKRGIMDPLSQIFDIIGGTSIGAIISLGVGHNIHPTDLIDLFNKNGAKIFSRTFCRMMTNLLPIFKPKYTAENLYDVLHEKFGDLKMKDLQGKVVITSCTRDGKPKIFTNINTSGNQDDPIFAHENDFLIKDVARCTSAAPVFFPPQDMLIKKIKEDGAQKEIVEKTVSYIDGGIWINNPAGVVATMAVTQIHKRVFSPDKIHILSLGTGDSTTTISDMPAFKDIVAIVDITMSSNSRGVDNSLTELFQQNYTRINPPLVESIKLDSANTKALKKLHQLAGCEYLPGKDGKKSWQFDRESPQGKEIYLKISKFVETYCNIKKSEQQLQD
ncbi:Patatin-like phospholipase family protein [Cavenderia fasciculata]|uniref:Patatin-like phospholipase family protein n=1 Tax=Cavenderia fasciculata TaxID=261658 RepID=F4PRN3_CACFS|nr:Patatin-like phospholipase family protein [Cavenderia fasciculata]EGG20532.1 Patatin-like phospholipase family protein [Cavenderia fasciculata]|eukprot:XP_004358382.1 Patatin-like phospholipase family protein [Cavenderia fasciculata]